MLDPRTSSQAQPFKDDVHPNSSRVPSRLRGMCAGSSQNGDPAFLFALGDARSAIPAFAGRPPSAFAVALFVQQARLTAGSAQRSRQAQSTRKCNVSRDDEPAGG